MTYLLDVNVLLAVSYEGHVHNARAGKWLDHLQTREASVKLATCSIAEIGFVRVACGKAGFAQHVRMAQRDLARLKAKRQLILLGDELGANLLPSWTERSGALLIPEQPDDPPMVREPPAHYGVAA